MSLFNPLISVIIPTYKGNKSLKNSIQSVSDQTYKNIEIIVVDDNDPQTEERKLTEQIIKSLGKSIYYYKHPKNLNGSAARNTGIKNANGDFICFLDDDDVYMPWRIQDAVDTLRKGFDIVFSDVIIYKNGYFYNTIEMSNSKNWLYDLLMDGNLIGTGSNLFLKRSIFDKVNGFNESYSRHQDYEFLIKTFLVNPKIGITSNYSIIKGMNGINNNANYSVLKQIKENIYFENKTELEKFLSPSELKNVIGYHTKSLLCQQSLLSS